MITASFFGPCVNSTGLTPRAHAVVAIITVISLLIIVRLVRIRQLRAKYALIWLSAGVVLLVLAAWPQLLDRASTALDVYYPPTTLFIVALVFLFMLALHFSWELSRLEERTRVLAEELALSKIYSDDARPSGGS